MVISLRHSFARLILARNYDYPNALQHLSHVTNSGKQCMYPLEVATQHDYTLKNNFVLQAHGFCTDYSLNGSKLMSSHRTIFACYRDRHG